VGFPRACAREKLVGVSAEQPSDGPLITLPRLAAIIEDIDHRQPDEGYALLTALTAAAWPTYCALDN
jgi:hypothetical protein